MKEHKVLFLTLTLKNVDHVTTGFYKGLWKKWSKFKAQALLGRTVVKINGKRRHVNRGPVVGGATTLETTYNCDISSKSYETWHPHLHSLLICSRYLSQAELANKWLEITGDSYIVDIRQVKKYRAREVSWKDEWVENDRELVAAVAETCKYLAKFSSLPIYEGHKIIEVAMALRNVRCLNSFGVLREFMKIELDRSPQCDKCGADLVDVLLQYFGNRYVQNECAIHDEEIEYRRECSWRSVG